MLEPGTTGVVTTAARTTSQLLTEAAGELGNLTRRLVDYGQADTAKTLGDWRTWTQGPIPIAVVGEVKRGKSTLVNALVGQALTPTDVDVMTQGIITVQPPTQDLPDGRARLTYSDLSDEVVAIPKAVAELCRAPVYPSGGTADVNDDDPRQRKRPIFAQLSATPRWVPEAAFIDTPGVGGLIGEHGVRARLAAERAGVLLFVSDGGQVLTKPELDFLRQIGTRAEFVVFALTKVDRTDGWETVRDENRRLLAQHAPRYADAPVIPVAAVLAEAAWTQDSSNASALEVASQIPILAAVLVNLARDRRRVAVAKALRIAVSGFEAAAQATVLEEAAANPATAGAQMVADQAKLAELNSRKSSLLRYLERDISRARADAVAVMNTLIDEATGTMSRRAQAARANEAGTVTEELRVSMQEIVQSVRDTFAAGLGAAIANAQQGLEPIPERALGAGAHELELSTSQKNGIETLDPERWKIDPFELAQVVAFRTGTKTSVFDPSMAGAAFMGSHLVPAAVLSQLGVASLVPFFGPVMAVGWVAVNLMVRRGRENRQQLVLTVNDSLSTLRRDLQLATDAVLRELRPDLVIQLEATLDRRIKELDALFREAQKVAAMAELERKNRLAKLHARQKAIVELKARAEALLAQIGPGE